MKVIIAPDSFKGSISSVEAAKAIADGIHSIDPTVSCQLVPMADGGEGAVEAILVGIGGERISCNVEDPLGRQITAEYGWIPAQHTAVVEMAAASGLPLLEESEYDPWNASTYGTGQLIRDALAKGAKKIILGLGGSATVDGGAGCLQALGLRFLNETGQEIQRVGGRLDQIVSIDMSELDPQFRHVEIEIASDVTNKLLGPEGSVYIFGPQKGVAPNQLAALERGIVSYADVVEKTVNKCIRNYPGSGAAGGFGFGLLAFANCHLESGFSLIAKLTNLSEHLQDADLVITGEGRIDAQSLYGKAPIGVSRLAQKHGVKAVAFAGTIGRGLDGLAAQGLTLVLPIVDQPMGLETALEQGPQLLTAASARFYQALLLGRDLAITRS